MLLFLSPPGSQPEALQAPGRAQKGLAQPPILSTLSAPPSLVHISSHPCWWHFFTREAGLSALSFPTFIHANLPPTKKLFWSTCLASPLAQKPMLALALSLPPSKLPLLDFYGFLQPTLSLHPDPLPGHHCFKCVFVYAWNAPAPPHPSRAHPILSMVVLKHHLSAHTICIFQCNSLLFSNCII